VQAWGLLSSIGFFVGADRTSDQDGGEHAEDGFASSDDRQRYAVHDVVMVAGRVQSQFGRLGSPMALLARAITVWQGNPFLLEGRLNEGRSCTGLCGRWRSAPGLARRRALAAACRTGR